MEVVFGALGSQPVSKSPTAAWLAEGCSQGLAGWQGVLDWLTLTCFPTVWLGIHPCCHPVSCGCSSRA